jgi:hypothetical protein
VARNLRKAGQARRDRLSVPHLRRQMDRTLVTQRSRAGLICDAYGASNRGAEEKSVRRAEFAERGCVGRTCRCKSRNLTCQTRSHKFKSTEMSALRGLFG